MGSGLSLIKALGAGPEAGHHLFVSGASDTSLHVISLEVDAACAARSASARSPALPRFAARSFCRQVSLRAVLLARAALRSRSALASFSGEHMHSLAAAVGYG